MPWVKVGPNKYRSPSGKIWKRSMIRAYLAQKHGNKKNKK